MGINTGECFCATCGLVLADNSIIPEQAHDPTTLKPTYGKIIPTQMMYSSWEKKFHREKICLNRIINRLHIPSYVFKQTLDLYHNAFKKRITVPGMETLIHACVYIVCWKNNIPRTPDEIVDYSGINQVKMMRSVRRIMKKMQINLQPINPLDLLPRFASIFNLSRECHRKAAQIIITVSKNAKYSSRKPKVILAAGIYIASQICHQPIPQTKISIEACTQEGTLRKISNEIVMDLNL
jgi:transcription initiation factor TFIIB